MTSKQNESNVHHFVPRSVLRRFAVDAERTFVMVFDKASGRTWQGGLTSTASGKGYNTLVQPDGDRVNFEQDFDEIDKDYAEIFDDLDSLRSLAGRDGVFLNRLADVVATQLLRTPLIRSTLHTVSHNFALEMASKGFIPIEKNELPDDNAIRQAVRDLIAERAGNRDALLAKDLILFEPDGAARFWISDHPVVRHSELPLGELGLRSLGVEIYLPISSDLLLGFLCPSLRRGSISSESSRAASAVITEDVIRAGKPLRIANSAVNFFNALQVELAQRFLYASSDDFELARKMLALRPDFSSNDTLIHVGEMGRAPPRPSNMPKGEWLYLETGKDYLMIPICDYQAEGAVREMSSERSDLVERAVELGRFERAEIFAKSGGGGMRGAKIVISGTGPPARFRLVFHDRSLQGLDEAINRDRRVR